MTPADRLTIALALLGAGLALVGLSATGAFRAAATGRHRAAVWACGGALVVLLGQLLALGTLSGGQASVLGGLIGIGGLLVALMLAVAWALRERHLRLAATQQRHPSTEPAALTVDEHFATAPAEVRRARILPPRRARSVTPGPTAVKAVIREAEAILASNREPGEQR